MAIIFDVMVETIKWSGHAYYYFFLHLWNKMLSNILLFFLFVKVFESHSELHNDEIIIYKMDEVSH